MKALDYVNGGTPKPKYQAPTCDAPYCTQEIDTNEPYVLSQPQGKEGPTFRFCGSGCYESWWRSIN